MSETEIEYIGTPPEGTEPPATRKPRTVPDPRVTPGDQPEQLQPEPITEAVEQPEPEDALREAQAKVAEAEAAAAASKAESRRLQKERDDALAARSSAETHAVSAYEAQLRTAEDAAKAAYTRAMANLKAANEAQDFEALGRAQDEFTDAKLDLREIAIAKRQLDNAKAQPRQQEQRQPTQQQPPGGPSAEAKRWLDAHPRFFEDKAFNATAIAGHNMALAKGHEEGSREYVSAVDDFLRQHYPEEKAFYPGSAQQQQPKQPSAKGPPASSTAAPSTREGSAPPRSGTMTAAQVGRELGLTMDDLQMGARVSKIPFNEYIADQARVILARKAGHDVGFSTGDRVFQ